ncbi:MAG TPA: twin-arginine translocase TatA/TatE family subunit [Chloroflexota bacterium]|nr:twin-arginine translocase TatA/TatE family subunit [Chloroflexota bacterium]
MLDIGMPEFLVIAIVALLVLGPDRLPEVMRRAGQLYRQGREMLSQYTAEAQRMFDEGMREVEDVSNTINTAWESATTSAPDQPPPPLRQLPPPLHPPSSAADAGPWAQWTGSREAGAEIEPLAARPTLSPFALQRQAPPPDAVPGGYASTSSQPPLAPAPPEADAPPFDPLADDLPELEVPPIPALPPLPDATPLPVSQMEPARDGAGATTNGSPAIHSNGAAGATAHDEDTSGAPDPVREQTVIELYLQGDLTWQKAAQYLSLTPEAFLDRVERARRAHVIPE